MTTTTLIEARAAEPVVRRMPWRTVLAMHLLPGAAAFAAALALGPLMRAWDLPPQFALTLAFAFVLLPIELGLLRRAAGGSLRRLPEVLAFRRKLPPRLYVMILPSLAAIALGAVVLLAPLEERIRAAYPASWLLPSGSAAFPAATMVLTLLVALLVEGLAAPVVEELYFRAYLLPRLPVHGALAVLTSAGLFAAQHYWSPQRFVFVFAAQVVLIAVMLRLGSVRIGIAVRCLINSLGILLSLAIVLL
jgi:membrane protease YdiL (CAAX protease family)